MAMQTNPGTTRTPSLTARMGLACYKCCKEEDVKLSRCTGCLRISYCSPRASPVSRRLVSLPALLTSLHKECQKDDWRTHKPFCKAVSSIEKNPVALPTLLSEATTDLEALRDLGKAHGNYMTSSLQRSLGRPLEAPELSLVGWEPRCMGCTRTEQRLRIEAAQNGSTSTSASSAPRLIPCPACNLSFCCSAAHWSIAHAMHNAVYEDGPDGLSQCALNQQIRGDVNFENTMISTGHDSNGLFVWAPERLCPAFRTLAGAGGWEQEFGEMMRKDVGIPSHRPMGPWIRAMSVHMSMPMTILHVLETFNGEDLGWTKRKELTIHLLGAFTNEIVGGMVFEEILHWLPELQTLKLVLCGPQMPGGAFPREIPMGTCPKCSKRGRKRIHEHTADTYHSYVRKQGTKYTRPDLAIAFNSGASQESLHTWPETFKVLINKKVPSVFTVSGV
ncbi:unnamed protein product [Mycena citricolor]|uniref:Mitochondrial splicing suppressor 51-like C-terminal domain-containing protein n=1 Tax=Mycena citricolor TaxID=2018698 RepID=A0AAD2Q0F7_9AGAR|nr:unnamed protein product [Mycena citricolor]